MDDQPDMIFMPGPPGTSHGNFGQYMSMGDINGDGNYDLVVGAPQWYQGGTSGKIFVYYGGADMDTTADFTITGYYWSYSKVGSKMSCGGDVNNDGFDDIFTYGIRPTCSDGVFLFYGGTQPDTIPDWEDQAPWGAFDYKGLNILPDINNDNYDDLAFADVFNNIGYLFHGGIVIPDTIADVTFLGNNSGEWTTTCNNIGDLNNDGICDYAIGSGYDGSISIYFLDQNLGNTKNYDIIITGDNVGGGDFSTAGDINGDGIKEFMYTISAYGEFDRGTVCIYGNPDLSVSKPVVTTPLAKFKLFPCIPNPFNSTTVITFELYTSEKAGLKIFDCLGREIEDLGFGIWEVGVNKVVWNAKGFSSGTYFIELSDGAVKKTTAVQLIK